MSDYKSVLYMRDILEDHGVTTGDGDSYKAYKKRQEGHYFSFREHVEAMILSLLSANRPWKQVCENKENLKVLFHDYDPYYICNTDPSVFIDGIKSLGCGNKALVRQMNDLKYNIELFERINSIIGDIDHLAANNDPYEVACILSDGVYKVKGFAMALALQYLRNVGVDTFKPDVHIRRILARLGFIPWEDCPVKQIDNAMKHLSEMLGLPITLVNEIIWCYGATGYGEVCAKEPKCYMCTIPGCPYRKCNFVPNN